jgi:hypothetical protein
MPRKDEHDVRLPLLAKRAVHRGEQNGRDDGREEKGLFHDGG